MTANIDRSKLPTYKREALKQKEDAELTKQVYKEFVEDFVEGADPLTGKAFVRGEVVESGLKKQTKSSAPKLYKPEPLFGKASSKHSGSSGGVDGEYSSPFQDAKRTAQEKARRFAADAAKNRPGKPGQTVKENSRLKNLAAFKEELKQMQEARDERRKVRKQLKEQLGADTATLDRIAPSLDNPYIQGSFEDDPNTTNLFMSNLNPDIVIEDVYEHFGKYGPLASAKVMYPRNEDEAKRGYLCGFVAFMTRKDTERAVAGMRGQMVLGFEMKMSWAKQVSIPLYPVYVPPAMMDLTMPPPPSGLPFNAQPRSQDIDDYRWPLPRIGQHPPVATGDSRQAECWNKMIRNAVVKVVIPTDRMLLQLIHRMVEFVVREGPMFEAMIMQREMNNPMFRFLFDNMTPAHGYYRWKLFSILQGNEPNYWSEKEFRMFDDPNSSLWRPPPNNFFQRGMPPELYHLTDDPNMGPFFDKREEKGSPSQRSRSRSRSGDGDGGDSGSSSASDDSDGDRKPRDGQRRNFREQPKAGVLSDKQRDKLEDLLRNLTPERRTISETMFYCVEHADCAEEIVECLGESLSILETPLHKKIARLYLVSDILSNCGNLKVSNVSYFRKFFGENLQEIFTNLYRCHAAIEGRLRAEQFKQRVMNCFRSWETQAIYPTDFLIQLQNVFLGLVATSTIDEAASDSARDTDREGSTKPGDDDFDLDGAPLSPSTTKANAVGPLVDYDLDGMPLDEEPSSTNAKPFKMNISGKSSLTAKAAAKGGFVKSKWEELDPETVEQQAMTTSKWDTLEGTAAGHSDDDDEDIDGEPLGGGVAQRTNTSLVGYDDADDDVDGVPLDDKPSTSTRDKDDRKPTIRRAVGGGGKQEMTEEKRKQLREIEVKVVSYQDELEGGSKKPPKGKSIHDALADYRAKLLEELTEDGEVSDGGETAGRKSEKDSSKGKEHHHHSSASGEHRTKSSSSKGGSERKKKRDRSKERDKVTNDKEVSRASSNSSSKKKKRSKSRSPKRGSSNRKRSRSRSRERKTRSRSPSDRKRKR